MSNDDGSSTIRETDWTDASEGGPPDIPAEVLFKPLESEEAWRAEAKRILADEEDILGELS